VADNSWVVPTLHLVARGVVGTIEIAVASVFVSLALGTLLGALLCLPRSPTGAALRWTLQGYLQLFRGLPVLVTLFIVFFVSPSLGIRLGSVPAAIAGLSLWGSANIMEVVRGAVRSIPTAQSEAASALGFGWGDVMRWVVLPQALKRALPPAVNLVVDLIQATTLAFLIGVVDVLQRSREATAFYQLSSGSGHATPIFAGVLLFFFLLCFPLTLLAGRMERRSSSPRWPSRDLPPPAGVVAASVGAAS